MIVADEELMEMVESNENQENVAEEVNILDC